MENIKRRIYIKMIKHILADTKWHGLQIQMTSYCTPQQPPNTLHQISATDWRRGRSGLVAWPLQIPVFIRLKGPPKVSSASKPYAHQMPPHHHNHTVPLQMLLPQTKCSPNWPAMVGKGFETTQVPPQLGETADKGRSLPVASTEWHWNKPGWKKPSAASLCLFAF